MDLEQFTAMVYASAALLSPTQMELFTGEHVSAWKDMPGQQKFILFNAIVAHN
jgi:hypothetical protein